MELSKCNRCGSFYYSDSNVCPKCEAKENLEMNNFKSYVEENGIDPSIDFMAVQTGISQKNLNRFLSYDSFKNYKNDSINLL